MQQQIRQQQEQEVLKQRWQLQLQAVSSSKSRLSFRQDGVVQGVMGTLPPLPKAAEVQPTPTLLLQQGLQQPLQEARLFGQQQGLHSLRQSLPLHPCPSTPPHL